MVFARLASLELGGIVNANTLQQLFRSGRSIALVRLLTLVLGLALINLSFSDDVRIAGGPGFGLTELILLGAGILNLLAALLGGSFMASLLIGQMSIAATLVVAELALRATVSHHYFSPYQLNDRYLYELVPGARRLHRHMPINGGSQLYRVNSLGFRGEEFAIERTRVPRVVIYGDSFIHAEYAALEQTLARQLSGRLSEQLGEPVEVINAGVAGYGPDQVLRRIENELDWLRPDLLVVAIFTGNDFGDLLRNKLYRLSSEGELEENDYVFSKDIKLNAALETAEPVLRKVGRAAKEQFLLRLKGGPGPRTEPVQKTEDTLHLHTREYLEYIIHGDSIVRSLRYDPYSADIALQPDSPSATYKLALMDAIIGEIHRNAKAQGVPLLLLGIPDPMDAMGGNHITGAVDVEKYPDYLASRLSDSIQAIAERQGIDHINLLPYFSKVDDPAELYLKGGDGHWNNVGQAYAADIIAEHVVGRRYLQRKTTER
jgi:hypothetical protein